MNPSIETVAALYQAALERHAESQRGIDRVLESAKTHGFSSEQIMAEIEKQNEERARRAKR